MVLTDAERVSAFIAACERLWPGCEVRPNKEKGKSPMAFEIKPNTGSIFRCPEKEKETDRDYSGQANIGGELFWVSGYVKTSKNGKKYLDLRYKPQAEKVDRSRPLRDDLDDAIPF
jgi:hypothetical protein